MVIGRVHKFERKSFDMFQKDNLDRNFLQQGCNISRDYKKLQNNLFQNLL